MEQQYVYPFTAIIGQERVKKALLMNVVNPKIGGVLITGERGTAKSTMVRALSDLLDNTKVVDLPLNVTEEMVIGSIKLDKAIKQGIKELEEGLLAKADGQILYIDEVNLLSDGITKIILDAASSGVNRVEREGMSISHPSRFTLVGTMNPEEGQLSPQFLDRFGLYVTVKGEEDVSSRIEIIKRRLQFEENPKKFYLQYKEENEILREKVEKAKERVTHMSVPDGMIDLCASIALQGNCSGHRADLYLIEAAKAIAALNEQDTIAAKDVEEAAQYVLVHRMREKPLETKSEQQQEDNENDQNQQDEDSTEPNDQQQNEQEMNDRDNKDTDSQLPSEIPPEEQENQGPMDKDSIAEIGEQFKIKSNDCLSKGQANS
ncbi:MAG: AAA family ATPase [Bacillus sp. (in: Bacteria)]|nr:AAA family ATPase [Bacillus sp. (in: firmicutes)]